MTGITTAFDPATSSSVTAATGATQIAASGVFQFTMPDNAITISAVATDAVEITAAYFSKTGDINAITSGAKDLKTMEALAKYITKSSAYSLDGLTATVKKNLSGAPTGIELSNSSGSQVVDINDIYVGANLAQVKVDDKTIIMSAAADTATVAQALITENITITNSGANTYILLDKGAANPTPQPTDTMTTVLTGVVEIKTNDKKGWAKIDTTDSYTATKKAGVGATAGAEWTVTLPTGQTGVESDGANTYLPIGTAVNLSVTPKAKILAADNAKGGITFGAGSHVNLTATVVTATPFEGGKDIETTDSVTVQVTISKAGTGAGKIVLTPANVTP